MENKGTFIQLLTLLGIIRIITWGFTLLGFRDPGDFNPQAVHSIETTMHFSALVICWIFSLVIGIAMFSMEYITKSINYLLSHPVKRLEVLIAKWTVGIGMVLVTYLVAGILFIFFYRVNLNGQSVFHFQQIGVYLTFFSFSVFMAIVFYFLGSFVAILGKDTVKVSFMAIGLAVLVIATLFSFSGDGIKPISSYIILVCRLMIYLLSSLALSLYLFTVQDYR